MSDKMELAKSLADVRRAYRLISLYQRRVLDLVSEISGNYKAEFYDWYPEHYGRLTYSGPLNRWAWDFLPLYNTSFLFRIQGGDNNDIRKGDWLLELSVITDSGFDSTLTDSGEPDASQFEKVEECYSKFGFYLWYATRDEKANWYHHRWNSDQFVMSDSDDKEGIQAFDENGMKIVWKLFDFTDLTNPAEVKSAADAFRQFASEKLGVEWDKPRK